jgi:hypothetical protein
MDSFCRGPVTVDFVCYPALWPICLIPGLVAEGSPRKAIPDDLPIRGGRATIGGKTKGGAR